jgi:hypothetical protein
VLRETTSRGRCELVCPSCTSELQYLLQSVCVFITAGPCVCVFITAGPSTKLFALGGGGYGRTRATRDDEPRPVWTRLSITH